MNTATRAARTKRAKVRPEKMEVDVDRACGLLADAMWRLQEIDRERFYEIWDFLIGSGREPSYGETASICEHCRELYSPNGDGHFHGIGRCAGPYPSEED